MDLDSINNFLILSETLNYSKAAEQLHITQPTLTKCIHRLEVELDRKLFYRNNRNVSLTPDGEIVRKHYQKIVNQNNALIEELDSPEEEEMQHIRVGFLAHTIHRYFPTFIRQFEKKHPNIIVHLIDGDQSSQIDAYLSGQLDVYIGTEGARAALSHREVVTLNREQVFLLVPVDSRWAEYDIVSMEDVRDETFIVLGNTISYLSPLYSRNNLTMRLCAEHQYTPRFITCRSFANIPLLVACNKGLSVVTKAAAFYSGDRVKFLKIKGHENDCMAINAYYDSYKREIVEVFVSELKEYITCKNDGKDE